MHARAAALLLSVLASCALATALPRPIVQSGLLKRQDNSSNDPFGQVCTTQCADFRNLVNACPGGEDALDGLDNGGPIPSCICQAPNAQSAISTCSACPDITAGLFGDVLRQLGQRFPTDCGGNVSASGSASASGATVVATASSVASGAAASSGASQSAASGAVRPTTVSSSPSSASSSAPTASHSNAANGKKARAVIAAAGLGLVAAVLA